MQKQITSRGSSSSSRWLPGGVGGRRTLLAMLCPLFLLCTFTIFFILSSNISYPRLLFAARDTCNGEPRFLPEISSLQAQLGALLQQLRNDSLSGSNALSSLSDQLIRVAVSLDKVAIRLSNPSSSSSISTETSQVDEDLTEPNDDEDEDEGRGVKLFEPGEVRSYISPKPNRQNGKKSFLGVEAIAPAVGFGCAHQSADLDRFMRYKKYEMCPDDWNVAQQLILAGCDPLPRRLCFSRASPSYTKPIPLLNSSLWTPPIDGNIMWSHYKCKSYACLVSDKADSRGFFKCADCFNLTKGGWVVATNESSSAEFSIDEVLKLRPGGGVRVGLDFSPTTGTFAALMRERNVTIASATLNLGAPFNEVVALRGLLPLYVSVGTRLPFFDNTLDIVHSTLFLDGWIGMQLLQFVLFDWDRVLRPGGLLWIDRFFCKKEDMKMYLDEFGRLGYRKLLWRVVPKMDKLGDELFFSAVLEKPTRK